MSLLSLSTSSSRLLTAAPLCSVYLAVVNALALVVVGVANAIALKPRPHATVLLAFIVVTAFAALLQSAVFGTRSR